MQFPKLTPLQSRFAACLGTSILLLIIYLSLHPSHFAYAAELDSILNEDHNHHRIAFRHEMDLANDIDWGEGQLENLHDGATASYQAEFAGVSRDIIGRAPLDTVSLKNNVPYSLNIDEGETQYYAFEKNEVFAQPGSVGNQLPTNVTGDGATLRKRSLQQLEEEVNGEEIVVKRQANSKTVFISINICTQPVLQQGKSGTLPQLTLYWSLDDGNQKPGPDNNDGEIDLDQGYGGTTIADVSGNVYIGIRSPSLPDNTFQGPWSYQVAASGDDYYHYYNASQSFLWTVDTDSNSALVATFNLTEQNGSDPAVVQQRKQWMGTNPPFSLYVFNQSSPLIDGIQNSYCGLSQLNMGSMQITSNITQQGVGQNPKQQFHVQNLQPGQTYFSVLAYGGSNVSGSTNTPTVGGGGQVWRSMQFTTKSDGNCRIIFDLDFCTDVAYAVPTNPQNTTLNNLTTLSQIYDNNAAALYQNFSLSLQQIPCNTTSTAQYSLASNCTDCARDYKTWLCAVTIPRCVDFSSPNTFLAPRNIGQPFPNGTNLDLTAPGLSISNKTQLWANSSRNPLIDASIKPGPYKELLPCKELCYDMVRSCPMALGFQCPKVTSQFAALSRSYGTFDPTVLGMDGASISQLSCNYLGVDWPTLGSGAARALVVERLLWGVVGLTVSWMLVW